MSYRLWSKLHKASTGVCLPVVLAAVAFFAGSPGHAQEDGDDGGPLAAVMESGTQNRVAMQTFSGPPVAPRASTLADIVGADGRQPTSLYSWVLAADGYYYQAWELLALRDAMERDLARLGRSTFEPGNELLLGSAAPPASVLDAQARQLNALGQGFQSYNSFDGGIGEANYYALGTGNMTKEYHWTFGKSNLAVYARGLFTASGDKNKMSSETYAVLGGTIWGKSRDVISFRLTGTASKSAAGTIRTTVTVVGKDIYTKSGSGKGEFLLSDHPKWPGEFKVPFRVSLGIAEVSVELGARGTVGLEWVASCTSWNPTVQSIAAPEGQLDCWGSAEGSYLGFGAKLKISLEPFLRYWARHTAAAYTEGNQLVHHTTLDQHLEALSGNLKIVFKNPIKDITFKIFDWDGYKRDWKVFDETRRRPL